MDDVLFDYAHERAIRYFEGIFDRRVFPDAAAIEGLTAFDEALPDDPTDALATIRLLDKAGSPATAATTGGRYFGYVTGGSLPVATAADWLVTSWDQTGTTPTNSPAASKIEAVAGRWVRETLGLPDEAATGFVTGASMGNLVGLAAARSHLLRRAGYDVDTQGMFGAPPLRVVVGAEVHSTVVKMLGILGFGRERLEIVEADDQGRMSRGRLPALDERTILILQAGNVNSGASDPFPKLIAAAREAGAWVHVDGAFGLWAAASPRYAHLVEGVAGADSWVTDGHKWLNVPYDSGIIICRHPEALRSAMGIAAAYLPVGEEVPMKDLVPELSRRARGVTVWAALRTLGRKGVAELVERCCAHSIRLAQGLREIGFEVHNDVVLNQVVATIYDAEFTHAVQRQVEEDGGCWFGPTSWQGRKAVRFSVSSWATTSRDIDEALAAIARAVTKVRSREAVAG
ncbi:MAG TPA: pyridoxal-dependent decarboxylase [Allosphingosinicella sp.]|uniref:pyridoxal phosphate-dependent decarboxylase family protein n=1 Tax=Allosphingosinicella sp. TaxID=2823234 RepID=UPI002EDBB169